MLQRYSLRIAQRTSDGHDGRYDGGDGNHLTGSRTDGHERSDRYDDTDWRTDRTDCRTD